MGVGFQLGGHPVEMLQATEFLILSPGVPRSSAFIQAALDAGVPVWSEIELAWRFSEGRVVGITGSNGKSTVTSWLGAILRAAGLPGATGGNLDRPFSEMLDDDGPDAVHALELSSFQLESVITLDCEVAIELAVTPDHLDRYDSFEDYVAAKRHLIELQSPDHVAVLDADAPQFSEFREAAGGKVLACSTTMRVERGGDVENGRLVLRDGAMRRELIAVDQLKPPGEHNIKNALLAAVAADAIGCPLPAIVEALTSFEGLPHRLEWIASARGVRFVNDSKATNVDAAHRALLAFTAGKVLAIVGGRDKAADWNALRPTLAQAARHTFLIGETTDALDELLGDDIAHTASRELNGAIEAAWALASPGDVILLAPACASFDQYASFEARGDHFRELVRALIEREEGHA